MTTPHLRLALLAGLSACNLPSLSSQDPSVPGVYCNLRDAESGLELQISSYGVEGDWTYGAFPSARLDGLEITTDAGARVEPRKQRYVPDRAEGGDFFLTLPPLEPGVQSIHVRTTFVGLDASGVEQISPDFDQDVRLP